MYYVYILYSPSHDRYYVGQTSDLSHLFVLQLQLTPRAV